MKKLFFGAAIFAATLTTPAYAQDFGELFTSGEISGDSGACSYSRQHMLFENNYSKAVDFEVWPEGSNSPIRVNVASNKSLKIFPDQDKFELIRIYVNGTKLHGVKPIDMAYSRKKCWEKGDGEKFAAFKVKAKKDGTTTWTFRYK